MSKILTDKEKNKLAQIYSIRTTEGAWKHFTNPKAIARAKEGGAEKVLSAISIEFKQSYSTIADIAREKGVITRPKQVRHHENGSTKTKFDAKTSWFTPMAQPNFRELADTFKKSGFAAVQLNQDAPEFLGMDIVKIQDGFKGKHGVKCENRNGVLFLVRKM